MQQSWSGGIRARSVLHRAFLTVSIKGRLWEPQTSEVSLLTTGINKAERWLAGRLNVVEITTPRVNFGFDVRLSCPVIPYYSHSFRSLTNCKHNTRVGGSKNSLHRIFLQFSLTQRWIERLVFEFIILERLVIIYLRNIEVSGFFKLIFTKLSSLLTDKFRWILEWWRASQVKRFIFHPEAIPFHIGRTSTNNDNKCPSTKLKLWMNQGKKRRRRRGEKKPFMTSRYRKASPMAR